MNKGSELTGISGDPKHPCCPALRVDAHGNQTVEGRSQSQPSGSLSLARGYFSSLDCIVGKTFPAASSIPVLIPWPISKYYYGEKATWKPLELSLVENHRLWHIFRGTAEMNANIKDLRGAG